MHNNIIVNHDMIKSMTSSNKYIKVITTLGRFFGEVVDADEFGFTLKRPEKYTNNLSDKSKLSVYISYKCIQKIDSWYE